MTTPISPSDIAASRDRVQRLIDREAITIVFQPIFDLQRGRVIGHEALTRPDPDSGFRHAGELYTAAHHAGLVFDLEHLARIKTFESVNNHDGGVTLFLNNSPQVLCDDRFMDMLHDELTAAPDLSPNRLVLELTERDDFSLMGQLATQTFLLREQGFQMAIDDVGAGTSGLNRIMTLRPQWLKLDRELVSNIDGDPFKQNMIRFLSQFSRISNIRVIGEGIERRHELKSLIELGIDGGQGYYLACPGRLDQPINDLLGGEISDLLSASTYRRWADGKGPGIGAGARPVPVFAATLRADEAQQRLAAASHDAGIIVVDGSTCIGWLPTDTLRDAEAATPIGRLRLVAPTLLDYRTPVQEAIAVVSARPESNLLDPLIITEHDRPEGMLTVRELLAAAARSSAEEQAHVTGLTGLPDRAHADRWLDGRIRHGASLDAVFIDLCDFGAYNEAYGLEMGDAMIRRLVGLIRATVPTNNDIGDLLIAHLGADRLLLVGALDLPRVLYDLHDAFIEARPEMFSPIDIAAGAFRRSPDPGHFDVFNLTGLRMVVVPDATSSIERPRDLYRMAQRVRATGTVTTLEGGVFVVPARSSNERDEPRLRITA